MDAVPPPKGPTSLNSMLGRPLGTPVIIMLILAGLALVTMLATLAADVAQRLIDPRLAR